MKLIIAGSRSITDFNILLTALRKWWKDHLKIEPGKDVTDIIDEIISGTACGVDILGEQFARQYNIKLTRMPAEWDKYGRSAGYKRNENMAKIATHLVVVWDGESKGSKHMINIGKELNLDVFIYDVSKDAR